jgi:drug/metabolite transporter (DMT)-like permease
VSAVIRVSGIDREGERTDGPGAFGCTPTRPCRPDALTLVAFAALVVLIGANPLAVRFTNREIPPLWGAGTRLAIAAIVFFGYVLIRRIRLPRGRDLRGALLFGVVQFGLGFGLGYWALVRVPASVAGVMLAAVPLFTLAFAVLSRVEVGTIRGLVGALVSISGIAVIIGGAQAADVSWPYLAAMVGFVACLAGGLVIAKALPDVHPAAMNAIGTSVGAVVLVPLALILGESAPLPRPDLTWAVQLYVALVGSVGVFGLILFVVRRWTATGASYQTVLSPPVTILLAAWLLGEPLSPRLAVGTVIVLLGVYAGALSHARRPSTAEA